MPKLPDCSICETGFFLAGVTAPDEPSLVAAIRNLIPGARIEEIEIDETVDRFYAPRITCANVNASGHCRRWLEPDMPQICRDTHWIK